MNIVQTRGGPRDAGPPSVESLGGQHSVGIDLTLAPNVSLIAILCNLLCLLWENLNFTVNFLG